MIEWGEIAKRQDSSQDCSYLEFESDATADIGMVHALTDYSALQSSHWLLTPDNLS